MPFFLKKQLFDEISNVLLKLFETLTTNSGASMKKMNCMCVCIYIYIYAHVFLSRSILIGYFPWIKSSPLSPKSLMLLFRASTHVCLSNYLVDATKYEENDLEWWKLSEIKISASITFVTNYGQNLIHFALS